MPLIARFSLLVLMVLISACAVQPAADKDDFVTAIDTPHTIDLTQDPDDVWVRIRRGFAIPNLNTPLVDQWTRYYAQNATSVLTMSERASKYLYFIVDELERRGMPTELALLPFVESAFNPTAYSRAHASGLWQFIPSTGEHYNLRQDKWLDERRDPVASTHAALDYLSYLFDFQGDWYLALASYNWGEGAVRRAIEKNEKADKGTDYLALKMPEETRNYVPKLQAIKNIIHNPVAYNIQLPKVNNEPYFTTVRGPSHMDVEVAAMLADMPLEEFMFLNPAYTRDLIPQDRPVILLPKENARLFAENLETYEGRLSRWEVYEPRPGERLSEIAERFDMSLTELRDINHLAKNSQQITDQQVLLVAASETKDTDTLDSEPLGVQVASLEELPSFEAASTKRVGVRTNSTPQKTAQRMVAREVQHSNSGHDIERRTSRKKQPETRHYTIQRGDTLYSLARRFNTSVQELQETNNLRGHNIPLGKRIIIPNQSL
ncbi:MAG TPA: transglycosylase SLT domain-containing protein [Paenalcaligenes sp.]|nr:transglycosylase SLT domain-containing protein [Paenalcaligenes sp.]